TPTRSATPTPIRRRGCSPRPSTRPAGVFLDAINPNSHDGEKIDTEVLLIVARTGKDLLYSAFATVHEVTAESLPVDIASATGVTQNFGPRQCVFAPLRSERVRGKSLCPQLEVNCA